MSKPEPILISLDGDVAEQLQKLVERGLPRERLSDFVSKATKNALLTDKELNKTIQSIGLPELTPEFDWKSPILKNQLSVIKLAIENGTISANQKDRFGDSILQFAAKKGEIALVRYMLAKGADCNVDCRSILADLANEDELERVKLLLKHGAEINGTGFCQATALHFAVQNHNREMVDVLLKKKPTIDARDWKGETPLFHAARYDYVDGVEVLLKHGADINAIDDQGNTALHTAIVLGKGTALTLVNRGADIGIKNQKGETALTLAEKQGGEIWAALKAKSEESALRTKHQADLSSLPKRPRGPVI